MKNETSIKPVTPPDAKRLLGDVFLSILNRIAIKNDMGDWMTVPLTQTVSQWLPMDIA
ncbi:MAG: hypothetical protein HWD58_20720 [Bacteroidota bacterium]|nr:MAG: hypothetical protein HWD58_20720 [Bacteroidota bacterium]